MPFIDRDELGRLRQAAELLTRHRTIITTVLGVYAEHMTSAAKDAKGAHAAGAETGLVTNQGFRQMGELFGQCATQARTAAGDITEWEAQ